MIRRIQHKSSTIAILLHTSGRFGPKYPVGWLLGASSFWRQDEPFIILARESIDPSAANTNIFKFDYEDETLNNKQLSFGVENMMHNTRVNKHYIKGKANSLHPPFAAKLIWIQMDMRRRHIHSKSGL